MSQSGVNTEEGEIAEFVKSIGPLVAIGRPGEELSFFGAARIYAGARDWKKRVRRLLSKAPLVIVRAGHIQAGCRGRWSSAATSCSRRSSSS